MRIINLPTYFQFVPKQHGRINTGMLYIIAIMIILFGFSYILSGTGPTRTITPNGTEVVIGQPQQEAAKDRLQLYTFGAATITPPAGSLCKPGGINTNPGLIIATVPAHGRGVRSDGQIKVWVNDSAPLRIAPGERINRGSGIVAQPGDRGARAPDGQLWEPAAYVFPETMDFGGRPYFPTLLRGSYENGGGPRISYGQEPPPAYIVVKDKGHSMQLVWNVKDLGLAVGAHQLQFSIHDGNAGRAIGCISIRVYEAPDPKNFIPI